MALSLHRPLTSAHLASLSAQPRRSRSRGRQVFKVLFHALRRKVTINKSLSMNDLDGQRFLERLITR
eukprot:2723309-Prymnesium_polylepis.1